MRILGLDIGEQRIGMAISDELGWTAQPLETLERRKEKDLAAAVGRVAGATGAVKIVFGLPLNMNGSEGPSARSAREFASKVKALTGLPVEPWDERLTTVGAERALLEADMSRQKRKKKIDQVAAQLILQGYLDSLRFGSSG
ncbi:MAG: Holliday junction resolvase RuvX [Deltaproteobacteria bacterium]|nr:Holliday junction resolvase RuvX [Deltaproteobacteria bacterium]